MVDVSTDFSYVYDVVKMRFSIQIMSVGQYTHVLPDTR